MRDVAENNHARPPLVPRCPLVSYCALFTAKKHRNRTSASSKFIYTLLLLLFYPSFAQPIRNHKRSPQASIMAQEIILYDIPTKDKHPRCWSLNPWKGTVTTKTTLETSHQQQLNDLPSPPGAQLQETPLPHRMARIPGHRAHVQGTRHPAQHARSQIPVLLSRGQDAGWAICEFHPSIFSTTHPSSTHSSPRRMDERQIMDSRSIAEALDALQPSPPLHMHDQSALIDTTMKALGAAFEKLRPMALPRVPTTLLSEKSARYFFDTRKEMFGMGLPDLAVTDDAQSAVKNAKPALEELKRVLVESKTVGK